MLEREPLLFRLILVTKKVMTSILNRDVNRKKGTCDLDIDVWIFIGDLQKNTWSIQLTLRIGGQDPVSNHALGHDIRYSYGLISRNTTE